MAYELDLLFERVVVRLSASPLISIAELAREENVSRRTLEKAVQLKAHISMRALRDRLIMQRVRAAVIANGPLWSIKELAFHAGYRSPRSFARAVRRTCGCTPQELRRKVRDTSQLAAIDAIEIVN